MKIAAILSLSVLILTACATGRNTPPDELPMFVGFDKRHEYKHTAADKRFMSAQIKNHLSSYHKAAGLWVKRGFESYQHNDPRMAMWQFNRAWLLDDKNSDLYWGYSLVLRRLGQDCEAQKMVDEALSILRHKETHLPHAAYLYTACAAKAAPSSEEREQAFARSERLFERASAVKGIDREILLREWVAAMELRGDLLGYAKKSMAYEELTGRAIDGKATAGQVDDQGMLIGFTPFGATEGIDFGTLIDLGHTGLKSQLLFDTSYLLQSGGSTEQNQLLKHLDTLPKTSVPEYSLAQKSHFMAALVESLSESGHLSAVAKKALSRVKGIEIEVDSATKKMVPNSEALQYSLIRSLSSNSGVTTGIAHKVGNARKPIVITALHIFNKVRVTLKFDKQVEFSEKLAILDHIDIDGVVFRIDSNGRLVMEYRTPKIVGFSGYRFDTDALYRYIETGSTAESSSFLSVLSLQ